MAKQNTNFSGTIGNVIFYEYRGQTVMRSKPIKVRQTKATKASAKDFGRAVRYSRQIRDCLGPLQTYYKDLRLMYRMNNGLLKWIRETQGDKKLMEKHIHDLLPMELNEDVIPAKRIKIKPEVEFDKGSKIIVTMPAFTASKDLYVPPNTQKIEFDLIAIRCNTIDSNASKSRSPEQYNHKHEIKYSSKENPEQKLELVLNTMPGDIVLVALGITYLTGNKREFSPVKDKKWLPGMLLASWYKQ